MVKVITGLAAAIGVGDDRNWNLDDSILDGMCSEYKIELSASLREDIKTALRNHITVANLESRAPKARETLKRVDSLIEKSSKLIPELQNLSEDVLSTISLSISGVGFTAPKLKMLVTCLKDFQVSADLARKRMSENIKGGPGPKRQANLEGFVLDMAGIFEKAGGNANAAYSPNRGDGPGGRNGPFVRFISELAQHLPQELHLPGVGLGDAINRILKDRQTLAAH